MNVAEEDLEEAEAVAMIEEQEAMVVLLEETNATTAKDSVTSLENAQNHEKKDLQEISTTKKIEVHTREEEIMMVATSTEEVELLEAPEVGITSLMREKEVLGMPRRMEEINGEVMPTLADQAKMHLKEQVEAGEIPIRKAKITTLKIILLVVGE